jgi:DNA-binding NtrC family response regulator
MSRCRPFLSAGICSYLCRTLTLREQLADAPGDLRTLILIVARHAVGDDAEEVARLAAEVERWVLEHLGEDYPWPGNVRELEQCVRNVLIRGVYHPHHVHRDDAGELADTMRRGTLSAEQLLQRYCALVYAQTRNYKETARRLGLDRRTVKAKVDAAAGRADGTDDEPAD